MNKSMMKQIVKQTISNGEENTLLHIIGLDKGFLETVAMAFAYGKICGKEGCYGRAESNRE